MRIGIIPTLGCNLASIVRGLKTTDFNVDVFDNYSDVSTVDLVVIPGVGNFGHVSHWLATEGYADEIREVALRGQGILGICLGLQLLCSGSEEAPGNQGLGLIPAYVKKFDAKQGVRSTHIGWDESKCISSSVSQKGLEKALFYYAHRYFVPSDVKYCNAEGYHGQAFSSVVEENNIFGVQFHPEKSQVAGIRLLGNVASYFATL